MHNNQKALQAFLGIIISLSMNFYFSVNVITFLTLKILNVNKCYFNCKIDYYNDFKDTLYGKDYFKDVPTIDYIFYFEREICST